MDPGRPRLSDLRACDVRFLAALVLPALALVHVAGGRPGAAAASAVAVWLGIAVLEAAWPALRRSPPAGPPHALLDGLLRLYVPLQAALLVAGGWAAVQTGWAGVAALAFAVGFVTGAQGITFAHELGHSRRRVDRALGWLLMASVGYPQFMVEHYRGHHVRAATHDDPATARLGESLWRFLPRTLAGTLLHAWQLEGQRLAQRRRGWAASPLAWATAANACLVVLLTALGQHKLLVFWLAQSAFAVWLLETVNYVEHYGLVRGTGADGRPLPFNVAHAWNADHLLSNSVLANLQRHSDHHLHGTTRYPALRALPGPQLPTGYAGCILLAAVPPVWFGLMHPRLAQARPAGA